MFNQDVASLFKKYLSRVASHYSCSRRERKRETDDDDVFYCLILSWPTQHTTPFFLPSEDPYLVLLRPNSTPKWEPYPVTYRQGHIATAKRPSADDTTATKRQPATDGVVDHDWRVTPARTTQKRAAPGCIPPR